MANRIYNYPAFYVKEPFNVKRKETQIGGRMIGFWDVLLGDMRVKETTNK